MRIDPNFKIQDLILPFVYVIGVLALGFLIEKGYLKKLRAAAQATKWKGDEVILESFKGVIIFWAFTIAAYLFIHHLPLSESVLRFLSKVILSGAILSVSILLGRILVGLFRIKTGGTAGLLPSSSIVANIIRITVLLIGTLVVLQTLGISITPVLTALGVGGLAVALALQDTLTNLFSGIQIIASKQIRTGDYVKLETGEEGYISDINWRSTTIRALSNDLILVPNSKLASAIVRNFQLPDTEIAVLLEIRVSYDSDLEKVEKVTIETAKKVLMQTEGGVKNFEPFIRYHSFSDSSINLTAILRADEFVSQYLIKHEFIKELTLSYRANSIEIPFPIRTIISKSENLA